MSDTLTAPQLSKVDAYRVLMGWLRSERDRLFPRHSLVFVDCDGRFRGYGVRVTCDECPPDQVPVLLENGNVWWYPIERCARIYPLKSIPRSARRMKLKHMTGKLLSGHLVSPKLP